MTNKERIDSVEIYAILYRSEQGIRETKELTPELEEWMVTARLTDLKKGIFK